MKEKCGLLRSKLVGLDFDIYRKEIQIKMGAPLDKLYKSVVNREYGGYENSKYKINIQNMETNLVRDYKEVIN